jgi:hypothetical protein
MTTIVFIENRLACLMLSGFRQVLGSRKTPGAAAPWAFMAARTLSDRRWLAAISSSCEFAEAISSRPVCSAAAHRE